MRLLKSVSVIALLWILSSCSNDLIHTWNIDRYEIQREDGKNTGYDNIGTLTFNKDGSGSNNYSIIEIDYTDKSSFQWRKDDGFIRIKSAENGQSRFSKAWIIVKDDTKKQIWKSTDGKQQVQTLVLSRN